MLTTSLRRLRGAHGLGALVASTVLVLTGMIPAAAGTPAPGPVGSGHAGSSLTGEPGSRALPAPAGVPGIDVSHYQGDIDWFAVAGQVRFVYIKATEGTGYTDPTFRRNYTGAYKAGLFRGAYHFALPDRSSGTAQARYFVDHGGGWSPDGQTLPPMLDLESNPYGPTCYGLTDGQMTRWITAFSTEIHRLTGRYPTIYTTQHWWSTCTGNTARFGDTNPLFIACYCDSAGTLPRGWPIYTFWQYTNKGSVNGIAGPVDENVFNGTLEQLRTLARGPV